jgi:hypothetical protein
MAFGNGMYPLTASRSQLSVCETPIEKVLRVGGVV